MSSTKSSKLHLTDDKKDQQRSGVEIERELLQSSNIFQEGYNFSRCNSKGKCFINTYFELVMMIPNGFLVAFRGYL